jgi:hypothetical protein
MTRILTLLLFIIQPCQLLALDFYWKGGNGDFNDPLKWTIGSSSGVTASQAPISTDNVYFDAGVINTGSPATIFINSSSNCHNFWADPLINNSSTLIFTSGSTQTLDIYGSFELSANVEFNFTGVLRFRSIKNGSEIIRSAGTTFALDHIEFDGGHNTEWVLQDSLVVDDYLLLLDNWDWTIPSGSILLYNGTLNSNKQTIVTDFFYSTNNSINRGILFDSSKVILKGYNGGDAKGWWIDFDTSTNNFNSFSLLGAQLIFDQANGLKQYGSFGHGLQYDILIGNNELKVSGSANFNYFKTQQSTYFVDSKMSINDLYLSPKHEHYFNCTSGLLLFYLNYYLEIDSFHSPTNCTDYITLRGYAKTVGTIRKKTSGVLSMNQVILENMNCDTTGGKSYILNQSINNGGNTGDWLFNAASTNKMLYVGTGNHLWRDPNNWNTWNGSNWVPNTQNCIPTPFTDVYINALSFQQTGSKWITIDSGGLCRDILWDSNTVAGSYMQIQSSFHIFGTAVFSPYMNPIQGGSPIYFHGQNDSLITNKILMPEIIFWKYSDYTIIDTLNAKEVHGWVYSTIRAKKITINTKNISMGNRYLDSVLINIRGTFYDFGSDSVFYSGNTTFNFTKTAGFTSIRRQKSYAYSNSIYLPNVYSNGIQLNFDGIETLLMGDLESYGNIMFRVASMNITGTMSNYSGKIILHEGSVCEIKNLIVADSFITKGSCNSMVTLRASGGSSGLVQMGKFGIISTFIQGLINVGPTVQTIASVDGGSNTNWSFNTGVGHVYYWRASALDPSDFAGNWSNPNHWTTNPNSPIGTLGGCMPTLSDTVIFDNFSFSASSNGCNIDNRAFCKTLICLADITITGDELYVGGSFILDNNMSNYNQEGVIYFVGEGSFIINLNNTQLKNCGVVFNNPNGEWALTNDFYLHDVIHQCYTGLVLDAGVFRTNGYTLTVHSRFRADRTTAYRVLDIRNSVVNHLCNDRYNSYYGYTWDISNSNGMQLLSTNSTVNFLENTSPHNFTKFFFMGDGLTYDKVNFLDTKNFMKIYSDANYGYAYYEGTTTIYGNNTYDSIALIGGHQWFLKSGKTQTLAAEHGKISAYGDASNFIYIESTTAGQDAFIYKEYGDAFCIDYVKVKDIKAKKGLSDPIFPSRHLILFFQTGMNSDNINTSATGIWRFTLPPALTVNATFPMTYQEICNGGAPTPIPFSLTGTYPYLIIVNWTNDLGQSGIDTTFFMDDDNDVNTPYHDVLNIYPVSNTTYTIQASGVRCGTHSFFSTTTIVNIGINSGTLVSDQSYGNCDLYNLDVFTHFFDYTTKRPMVSIKDKVDSTDLLSLGIVENKVYFDTIVQYWNSMPYLQRHWLTASENAQPAKVRLYFTQAELSALAISYFGSSYISLQHDLFLIQFPDTILVGTPDTIPYTVIPVAGSVANHFTSTNDILAIEFETNNLGAYILSIREVLAMLPLELVNFNAQKQGKIEVLIDWETEQETNLKEYILERSLDAVTFEPIHSQQAKLSANTNYYTFTDEDPNLGINYYRLKIIENDGTASYSPIRSVLLESSFDLIKLIPNPSNNQVVISLVSSEGNNFLIDIYDIRGVLVLSNVVQGKQGTHKVTINTKDWVSGVYIIRLSDHLGWATNQKIRVQH